MMNRSRTFNPVSILFFFLRAGWWVCLLVFWGAWLFNIPDFLARASAGTLPTIAPDGIPPAQQAAAGAAAWGVTEPAWAWIHILLNGISFLIPCLIGALILWRVRSGFGILTAYILLGTGSAVISTVVYSIGISGIVLSAWRLSALVWTL